jgi:hypothetical protein
MYTAAATRQALGLSLFEMSTLLQVSKPSLGMHEKGSRTLPPAARLKLSALQTALVGLAAPHPPSPATIQRQPSGNTLQQALDELQQWCHTKGKHYLKLAAQLALKNEQAALCLKVLPVVFGEEGTANAPDTTRSAALRLIIHQCRVQLKQYPPSLVQQCRQMGSALLSLAASMPQEQPAL